MIEMQQLGDYIVISIPNPQKDDVRKVVMLVKLFHYGKPASKKGIAAFNKMVRLHKELTMPWASNGWRALRTVHYEHYRNTMQPLVIAVNRAYQVMGSKHYADIIPAKIPNTLLDSQNIDNYLD